MKQFEREILDFTNSIESIAKNYYYVVTSSLTSFNLIRKYCPELKNVISTDGILLHFNEILDFYKKNKSFPRILIIDDIVFNEINIMMFYYKYLETIMQLAIKTKVVTSVEGKYELRKALKNSISINVYAKNDILPKELLPFRVQLYNSEKLHCDKLRRFYINLLKNLDYNENDILSPFIMSEDIQLDFHNEEKDNTWMKLEWECEDKNATFYLKEYANRYSTIRYYDKEKLLSLSIIKEIDEKIVYQVQKVLLDNSFIYLGVLLRDGNQYIKNTRGLIINYLISLLDMMEFLKSIRTDKKIELFENSLKLFTQYFAMDDSFYEELERLINSDLVLEKLSDIIKSPDERIKLSNNVNIREINEQNLEYFYMVNIEIEKKYKKIIENRFLEQDFQSEIVTSQYGKDGMILFNENNIYKLMSDIMLMDSNFINFNLFQDDNKYKTVCQTKTISSITIPRKLNVFIPSFALVERRNYRLGMSEEDAVLLLYNSINLDEDEYLLDSEKQIVEKYIKENCPNSDILKKYTKMLYESYHSYGGWNIPEVIDLEDEVLNKFQIILLYEAYKMLGEDVTVEFKEKPIIRSLKINN